MERTKIKSIPTVDFVLSKESMSDDCVNNPLQNQSGSDEEGAMQLTRMKYSCEMANGSMESLDQKTKSRLSDQSHTMLLKHRTGVRQPPVKVR